MAAGGKRKTEKQLRKGKPTEGNLLSAARQYGGSRAEAKANALRNRADAQQAEERRVDSVAGDEPPISEAENQRRKRGRVPGFLGDTRRTREAKVTPDRINRTYKAGGCVGDGIATRGRTKGTMR